MDLIPEKYRYDLEIIRETAEQIIRDFNIKGFEIIFSGKTHNAFEEFKAQIIPVIGRLFNADRISFQSLLYRIDISEKDYKKVLSRINSKKFEEELSELIIRREFLKVITRKHFSDNNGTTSEQGY